MLLRCRRFVIRQVHSDVLFSRLPLDFAAQVAQERFPLLAGVLQPLGLNCSHPARPSRSALDGELHAGALYSHMYMSAYCLSFVCQKPEARSQKGSIEEKLV